MFDLMQYALIFYDFQLILAQMGAMGADDWEAPADARGCPRTLGDERVAHTALDRAERIHCWPKGTVGGNAAYEVRRK